MTKITLTNVGDLTNTTTAAATINANNSIIQAAMDNTLSRDGTSPNPMGSALDMNSNNILNLPAPATATSPLRLQDLSSFIGGGTISTLPTGGTTGQLLTKHSNTNYDVNWTSQASSLTAGTNISITGTTPATIATSATPTFSTINKVILTQPATGSTLTVADGKTFTSNNTLTIAGGDGSVQTFPNTSGNVVTSVSPAAGVLSGSYPNPGFASIATGTMLANTTGSSAAPSATALPTKHFTVFTASGTFTTPANSTSATVYKYKAVGAGGGGGGANGTWAAAGGGGAGAYVEGSFTGVAASTGITITVGTAGTAGASTGATGGAGGDTVLGTPVSITAGGGAGGIGTTAGAGPAGSEGGAGGVVTGSPSVGFVGAHGGRAYCISVSNAVGGSGGSTPLGAGGVAGSVGSAQAPLSASGYGAGGGGAILSTTAGGAGMAGLVTIEYVL